MISTSPLFRPSTVLVLIACLIAFATGCVLEDTGHGDWQGVNAHPAGHSEYDEVIDERGDQHDEFEENEFIDADDEDTSTFAVDVSTASYTLMRRDLEAGRLPDPAGVRLEEYINFFQYDYPEPDDEPFSLNLEAAPSHFGSSDDTERHMLRLGMQGQPVSLEEMKPTNLVFLVDVSGSMSPDNRLPLAKQSLQILLEHLRDTDTVGIQTYASGSETVLEPTKVQNYQEIEGAIDTLEASGSTYGEGGIIDAYDMAEDAFVEGGNNRVVILTDGDFNVGKTGDDLVDLVKDYRDREISLTSVGFGHGNYNDATMERLARQGNGNYFYVDTHEEAHRIFGTELPSTVEIIAHDVRNQVEFDSDVVDRHRLVGYEKRLLDNDEFDDEDANGGEIGAGHTVTAFYELELHDDIADDDQIAEWRINHKERYGDELNLQTRQLIVDDLVEEFVDASDGFRFATAVTQFAGILGESQYVDEADFDDVAAIADDARYPDYAEQQQFVDLVHKADELWE